MALETYLVTYMIPVTVPIEAGAGPESARRLADSLMAAISGTTVRIVVQGVETPMIVEAELGQPTWESAQVADADRAWGDDSAAQQLERGPR